MWKCFKIFNNNIKKCTLTVQIKNKFLILTKTEKSFSKNYDFTGFSNPASVETKLSANPPSSETNYQPETEASTNLPSSETNHQPESE